MKKIIAILVISLISFNFTNANFSDFINSPNKSRLSFFINLKARYCEEVFLKAYMRREFSDFENDKCRNVFAKKIEDEMEYKYQMLNSRGIY